MTKDEISDSEAAEETKVLWFVRCMKNILGPVGVCSNQIETWPLVQGYAIDLFGCGFFSETHPQTNISEHLEPFFGEFDEAAIDILISEHLPRLKSTFEQTIEFVNKRSYPTGRGELKEDDIKECLCLPYEYVMIASTKVSVHKPQFRLWGEFDGVAQVKNATHMNLQGVCALSGLIAARSWFFIPQGSVGVFLENQEVNDLVGMMELYKAIVNCTRKALKNIPGQTKEEFNESVLGYS